MTKVLHINDLNTKIIYKYVKHLNTKTVQRCLKKIMHVFHALFLKNINAYM